MAHCRQSLFRFALALALGLLAAMPARAQLDPKLQSGSTDFLDLFQQSSSKSPKPEIVSVFDFSTSMKSLMFHPLYQNTDLADADIYREMVFTLTPGTATIPANNGYWVQASADGASSSCGFTINSDSSATFHRGTNDPACTWVGRGANGLGGCGGGSDYSVVNNTPPTLGVVATGHAGSSSINLIPVSNSSTYGANNHTSYTAGGAYSNTSSMSGISVSPAGPWTPGTTVTLTVTVKYVLAEGEASYTPYVSWSGADQVSWTDLGSGSYRSQATVIIPDFVATSTTVTHSPNSEYDYVQLAPIMVALSSSPNTPILDGGTIPAGAMLIFKTYFLIQGGAGHTSITWMSGADGGNVCNSYIFSGYTDAGKTLSSATSISDVPLPVYCTNGGAGGADARVDVAFADRPNVLIATTAWGGQALRKPDGSAVTAADASTCTRWGGANDVFSWIMAASHVRVSRTVVNGTGKSVKRTIDIPIPWKILDRSSTGVPLSSVTILDRQVKDGTTYGSGLQLEMDTCYKFEDQRTRSYPAFGDAAAGDTHVGHTSVRLSTIAYRPAYVDWLFNGKYQSTDALAPNYTTDSALAGSFIVFDAVDATLVKNQDSASWGQGFGPTGTWGQIRVPSYNLDGSYAGVIYDEASRYRTPALTRVQAIKKAHVQSWVAHQAEVYWAFRCLDPVHEATPDPLTTWYPVAGTVTSLNNDSKTTLASASSYATPVGQDSGWTLLNNTAAQGPTSTTGNSVLGLSRLASLFATGDTPLTYAMARTLAQFNDASSVFNDVVGSPPTPCGKHFLILFTDGVDNNGNATLGSNPNLTTPYVTGTLGAETFSALLGNQTLIKTPALVNRDGANWNLFTFAAAAAHLADASLGTKGTDYLAARSQTASGRSPSGFLPFAIHQRNGVTYNPDHLVTTMTVGVSLAGQYTNPASPKRSLFLAALLGRPGLSSGVLSTYHAFRGWDQAAGTTIDNIDPKNDWIPDPKHPTEYPARGVARDNAIYFFDATDPDRLTSNIEYAFRIAISAAGNQATATPTLPFIGASLGRQLYTGQFYPPSFGGVLWPGDLLSFGTQEGNGNLQILDRSGAVTTTLTASTAMWSASAALLKGPIGTARTLYTRIPNGTALQAFTDSGASFDDATTGLKNYVATSLSATLPAGLAQKKIVLQHAAGADITKLDGSGKPTANRASIMGDIINSAPAVLEYNWTDVNTSSGTPGSKSLSSYADLAALGGSRFRLILVGTNQGWLHAFGEVTKTETSGLITGAVQELWAFMPTDFLGQLDYLTDSSKPHRFLVDGSPTLYHLDLPPSGGGSGNGLVDKGTGERAVAIFGLGKGGRSYYALDVSNPFVPSLRWALVPDEAASFPATRINSGAPTLATVQGLLKKFGFSTSPPAIGRVVDADGKLRDAVFLGGGFSTPEVEANYPDAASKPTLLGRSVMALDAYSGSVLAAVDLTLDTAAGGSTTIGPVGAGVVPFEFVLNSGLAQRAYFLDYRGGLWAWGSREVATAAPFNGFRKDSSKLSDWKLRKVYQDDNANKGARYTTPPAPFRVGLFPGAAVSGSAIPTAVGIAMVSGDRNNIMDSGYITATNPAPTRHRLTVVFDRQDSRGWALDSASGADKGITSSQLKDFTLNNVDTTPTNLCDGSVLGVITPGCDNYYLAPKTGTPAFGYYVNFPEAVTGSAFVAKGINPPLVVAGSLFYATFLPTSSDICSGGAGTTSSWLLGNVMSPIVTDTRAGRLAPSGLKLTWPGLASDFIALGTRGALQGGLAGGDTAAGSQGSSVAAAQVATILGNPVERYNKPRVWRTVH